MGCVIAVCYLCAPYNVLSVVRFVSCVISLNGFFLFIGDDDKPGSVLDREIKNISRIGCLLQ